VAGLVRAFSLWFWPVDAASWALRDADVALWNGAVAIWLVLWVVLHLAPRGL
jgi:hypothetical protein